MSREALEAVAQNFLFLSALHHLAIAVVMVIFWIRRRSMETTVAVYFAAAFATCAFALASHADTRVLAVLPAVLCALWCVEAVKRRNALSFRRTPKLRLVIMAAAGAFALLYPGYSEGYPVFIFSPLGVLLPPTLIAALAVLNCASPHTDRRLHWSLAASGLAVGAFGLATEGVVHVPLVVASGYAVPLLLGRGKLIEERAVADGMSVRAMTNRMHKRRVLLTRPRRTAVRKLDVRKRRR